MRNGGLAGTRTLDQCLKRALLYQLSYQPAELISKAPETLINDLRPGKTIPTQRIPSQSFEFSTTISLFRAGFCDKWERTAEHEA